MKIVFTLVLLGLAAACSNRPPENPRDYVAEIAAARAAKDDAFKSGSDSPVPQDRRAALLPLAYFPVEPAYKTAAVLKPAANADTTVIPFATSTGTVREMRRVGGLEFSLKDRPLKLTAFVEVGARDLSRLFVPFT